MAYVYIVKCKDNTLYTGWTTNIERRIHEHNTSKKGAKYTLTRRPVKLVYFENFPTKIEAQKREYFIKQLCRKDKLLLITSKNNLILK